MCVQFAEAACGDATAMLSGSIDSPFDTSRSVPPLVSLLGLCLEMVFSQMCFVNFSIFGKIEVPKLSPSKVKKLTVVLVMPTNPK